jgi:hypothetical protein
MNSKTLFIIALCALALSVLIGLIYFQREKEWKAEENQYKIKFASGELNLVFPTYSKAKEGADPKGPDLKFLVDAMNMAQSRGNPSRFVKRSDVKSVEFKPMPYRIGKPDGPWQVVLIYEKETRKVRAEAYGDNLSKPVSVFEYPCCHW